VRTCKSNLIKGWILKGYYTIYGVAVLGNYKKIIMNVKL
jgi:hypothetical protein